MIEPTITLASGHSEMSSYQIQWEEYRTRRRKIVACMIIEFLAFVPVVGIVSLASRRLFSIDLAFPAMLLWGILYIYTGSRLRSFLCPRCGKNFVGGILGDSSLLFSKPRAFIGRECANCGLEKYGDDLAAA